MSVPALSFFLSDKAQGEQCADNDIQAFEITFKQYYSRLTFFANRFLNDLPASEEIVSDVFAQLWEQREQVHINTSTNAYLYRMVQNKCLNYLKHKKIESEYVRYLAKNNMLTDIPAVSKNPSIEKELQDEVQKAIAGLPEKCREVFTLSRFEQLKNKEIAEHLNISPKTVERHMTIALERLRSCLKHLFVFSAFLNFF